MAISRRSTVNSGGLPVAEAEAEHAYRTDCKVLLTRGKPARVGAEQ